MKKRRMKPRPTQDSGPRPATAMAIPVKKGPAPAPVSEDEYEEEYEDGEEEYEDEEDAVEAIAYVKATPEQILSALITRERNERKILMNRNIKLENEMAVLRKEVADTRIHQMVNQAAGLDADSARLWREANVDPDLKQIKQVNGEWVICDKDKPQG